MTTEQLSQQVRQTLAQLQQLSRSDQPTSRVVARMLELLVDASGAHGGVVWLGGQRAGDAAPAFQLAGRSGQADLALDPEGEPLEPVRNALATCFNQTGKALVVSPDQAEFNGTALASEVQFYLPIAASERTLGVLQLIAPGTLNPKVYREYVAFAQQTAQAVADYLGRRRSALRDEEANRAASLLQITRQLSELEDPETALHELANAARRTLDCQRAAAVKLWDHRPKVFFSDAVDTHRRAVVTRAARMLAEQTQQREAPIIITRGQELDEADRELTPLADDLFEHSAAASACLIPIHDGEAAIGVLIAEYDEADPGDAAAFQQQIAEQVGPMLGRLVRWRQRPLRRTAALIDKARRNPRASAVRTLILLGLLAAAGAGLFATPVPIPLRVDARLEPRAMATITAPFGGQVEQVLVESGEAVEAGQPLLQLDPIDLRAQLAEVTRQIELERVARDKAHEAARRGEATPADVKEAALKVDRLTIRRRRIERRIERATIRAPIAGRVLNEGVDQLANRNLREGESLIRIGDLRQFRLTLDIAEADLAPIQRRLAAGHDVPVTFISRTMPNVSHKATLRDLGVFAPTAVGDPQKRKHVFHATVPIELRGEARRMAMANPTGRARLDLGTGSVVYRYFRRAYHFFRMKLWF